MLSQSLDVRRGEGDIAAPLGDLAARYHDLSVGCYPTYRDGIYGATVVIRGTDPARLDAAMGELATLFPEAVG